MPGPEIMGGEGVVFAFVNTCPKRSMIPKSGNRFSEKTMLMRRQGARAL
jgi:hypothetical protein